LQSLFFGGNKTQNTSIAEGVRFTLLAYLVLFFTLPSLIFAAGTPAGTSICNQALATYAAANGVSMPPISSNAVCITVQQVATVNITPPTASRTSQVNTIVDYSSTVTNSGNGADAILLSAVSSHGFATAIYDDVNGNSVLDPSEVALGTITQTGSLPADSSSRIITRVTIPNNVSLNGQTDIVLVVGTSAFDVASKDTGSYSIIIASATLAFTKSVSNTVPRGGDRVTYTISYVNSGSADASNVTLDDVLDTHLRYVNSSANPPPGSVVGQTISWNLGTIGAGASGSIAFQVDIVNNTTPGTEIHNVAQIQYRDGPNVINIASVESNFMTVQSGGVVTVDFTPNRTRSGEPGDTVDYALTVTNNGSLAEAFTLSYVSNQSLIWTYYHDANGNGTIDSSETTTTATGSLAGNGGQYNIVARTVLGVVSADGTIDVTAFRVTSTTNAGNFKTATGTTTIFIPVMSMVKIADSPEPKPGREIRYQITYTNGGGGHAIQFVVTDAIPANTTYIPQSVRHNSIAKTDEADSDEVSLSSGVITVNVGTVNPAAVGVIEFRVRIN
jgi:uncharacterized repeat protein (TIGR01451 family)